MSLNNIEGGWISTKDRLPTEEGYYDIKYEDGEEDQKPFRIRPKKNIYGFMTMDNVAYWREYTGCFEPID